MEETSQGSPKHAGSKRPHAHTCPHVHTHAHAYIRLHTRAHMHAHTLSARCAGLGGSSLTSGSSQTRLTGRASGGRQAGAGTIVGKRVSAVGRRILSTCFRGPDSGRGQELRTWPWSLAIPGQGRVHSSWAFRWEGPRVGLDARSCFGWGSCSQESSIPSSRQGHAASARLGRPLSWVSWVWEGGPHRPTRRFR